MPKIVVLILLFSNFLPQNGLTTRLESVIKGKFFLEEKKNEAVEQKDIEIRRAPGTKENNLKFESGRATLSIDLATNTTISENNADNKLQIASLTKLMTTYIALKDLPLDQIITVPKLALREGDATMGIIEGEKLSVLSALKGLLINSGSDAAQTLAVADSGTIDAFVGKMNTRASELELTNTHFANPVGWDDQNNYSSARDIANLTRVLLGNKTFREIITKKSEIVQTATGRSVPLSNTNILLANPNYIGVKTGYTPGAGECLVTLNNKDNHEVLTVILGSSDRFGQTEYFLDWIYTHFSW